MRDPLATEAGLNTVRVCVRRSRASLFSMLSGVSSVYISAKAVAQVQEHPSPYAIMALSDQCRAMVLDGGADVTITGGGSTYTNGSACDNANTGALRGTGGATLSTPGGSNQVTGPVSNPSCCTPTPTSQDVLDDPYADYPQPNQTGLPCQPEGTINGGGTTLLPTLNPGAGVARYCNHVQITGNPTVRLRPGVYIFEQGLTVNSGTLTDDSHNFGSHDGDEEVLLYSTCPLPYQCSGRPADDMSFGANARVILHGRDDQHQMVLWTDRTSGGTPQIDIQGNANNDLFGRVYNFSGLVDIGGNSGVTMNLNMSVVADQVSLHGDVNLNMAYNQIYAPTERTLQIIE